MSADAAVRRKLTWALYLEELLPNGLTEAGLDPAAVTRVVADVTTRARDYAASGRAARRALRVPFLDDVVAFQPVEAPIGTKANVAVVVRNSLLESEHAAGRVNDAELTRLTYLACGALAVWLTDHATDDEHAPPAGVFEQVANYPRAFTALQTLALAAENGGRQAYRKVRGPLPELPTATEATVLETGAVHRSGISGADHTLVDLLADVAAGDAELLLIPSLSRYSRDSVLLAHILEIVLAQECTVLTTNMMLRPGEAFARRPPFTAADSHHPFRDVTLRGLSGVHAKRLAAALEHVYPDR